VAAALASDSDSATWAGFRWLHMNATIRGTDATTTGITGGFVQPGEHYPQHEYHEYLPQCERPQRRERRLGGQLRTGRNQYPQLCAADFGRTSRGLVWVRGQVGLAPTRDSNRFSDRNANTAGMPRSNYTGSFVSRNGATGGQQRLGGSNLRFGPQTAGGSNNGGVTGPVNRGGAINNGGSGSGNWQRFNPRSERAEPWRKSRCAGQPARIRRIERCSFHRWRESRSRFGATPQQRGGRKAAGSGLIPVSSVGSRSHNRNRAAGRSMEVR
jgi:hypothetical protein